MNRFHFIGIAGSVQNEDLVRNLVRDLKTNLLLILVFWIMCLVFACFFLYLEKQKRYPAALVTKGLASLCFVMLGFMGAAHTRNQTAPLTVFIGLCLGMFADILLNMRFIFRKNGQRIFLLGIFVFLAGHLMYIFALVPMCSNLKYCLVFGSILAAFLIVIIFPRINAKRIVRIVGTFYLTTICVMTCIAVGVFTADPLAFSALFALGAVLFLLSDIILIMNTFGGKSGNALRISNIIFYYIGQALIASSLLLI